MKKFLFTLAVTVLSVGFAGAQKNKIPQQYYSAAWSVALPVFDYSEYISSVSLNGAAFQMQFFIQEKVTAGVSFGWNTYYAEVPNALYIPSPDVAVSATSYRYLNAMPLKASVNYFFGTNPKIQPYIGLGLGATYMTEHAVVHQVNFWDAQWGFLAAPEIGMFIPLPYRLGIHFSATYSVSMNAFTFGQIQLNSIHTLGVAAGISYML
jgi:opacity protein-like surface antigen